MEGGAPRYRTPRLVACAAGAILGVILVLLSFLPGAPVYPSGVVIVLFVCVLEPGWSEAFVAELTTSPFLSVRSAS